MGIIITNNYKQKVVPPPIIIIQNFLNNIDFIILHLLYKINNLYLEDYKSNRNTYYILYLEK